MRSTLTQYLSLAACTQSSASIEPTSSSPLTSDHYFVGVTPPFESPDQCLTSADFHCHRQLVFCQDGDVTLLRGDLEFSGTYDVVDSVALADLGAVQLAFELETLLDRAEPGTQWLLDNEHQWDDTRFGFGVIRCAAP